METKIFFTVNAGLYFFSGKTEILIDGLHDAGTAGFHAMPEEMIRRAGSEQGLFIGSGTLLFTHLHRDHYDAEKVCSYLDKHPDTALWGPGLDVRGIDDIKETGKGWQLGCGDFDIKAVRTLHSGAEYKDVEHYSFLIRNNNCNEYFFVAGDSVLDPEQARQIRKETAEKATKENVGPAVPNIFAFVMVYQLLENGSREFLKALAPARVFQIHRPLPGEAAYEGLGYIMDHPHLTLPGDVVIESPEPMNWIK